MDRLGLGYDALRQDQARASSTARSPASARTARLRGNPAYDQIIQGLSGVMSVTGTPDTAPLRVGYPVCDTIGGITAAFAIAAALVRAGPHRRGRAHRRVDARGDAGHHGLGRVQLADRRRAPGADGQREHDRRRPPAPSGPARACSTSPRTSRSSSRPFPGSSAGRTCSPTRASPSARTASATATSSRPSSRGPGRRGRRPNGRSCSTRRASRQARC